MKKNFLQIGILGSIALGLAAYLAWDFSAERNETARKEAALKLFSFVADQVNELRIERPDMKLKITRSEDGWKIVQPMQDEADNDFTDDFVSRVVQEKYFEIAKEGEKIDLKVYGLDQPIGSVTLKTQAGAEKTYEVSAKTNFEQNAFLREPNGNRVYIATGTWPPSANRGPLDFRNKKLYRGRLSAINEIKIQNQFGSTDLLLSQGKWVLKDKPWSLDQNKVREIISMLGETRAEDFAGEGSQIPLSAGDRKKYALESPKLKLELVTEKSTWKAEFGKPQEKALYVLTDSFVLKLATNIYQKFDEIEAANLREKTLPFDFPSGEVQSLEWKSQLQTLKIKKEGSGWVLELPNEASTDFKGGVHGKPQVVAQDKMEILLKTLREMSVSRYAAVPQPKEFPQILRLKNNKNEIVFELAWGNPEVQKIGIQKTNVRLAKTNKFAENFWLDENSIDRLGLKNLLEPNKTEAPQ